MVLSYEEGKWIERVEAKVEAIIEILVDKKIIEPKQEVENAKKD